MITLIYNQITTGTCKHQDFKDPVKAFDKFYSMLKDARRDPFISSDDHIGFFTHRDVEWFMLNDQEGKDMALIRFKKWLEHYKR
jgi:hypothetical protein